MKVQVLLPTAGTGERMGAGVPKPLLPLAGEPVVIRTLKVFERSASIDSVILIVHEDYKKDYQSAVVRAGLRKVKAVVVGGSTRTQSVRNGLSALDRDTGIVMVHDGVRPLVTAEIIERGLHEVADHKAVVAAVPVKPTLKVVSPTTHNVTETLDRSLIWEIQTPQIFERSLLERAYREDAEGGSDDAVLVEKLGVAVRVYMGDYRNIKITTPEDMQVAEAFLKG